MNTLMPIPPIEALLLHTVRLDLMPVLRKHAGPMFEVLKDPALYEFTGGTPPLDVETLARLFDLWEKRISPDGSELWFNWVLRERQSSELIGHAQAGVTSVRADIAWTVGLRWQNCGYASEAARMIVEWLRSLGVPEIRASINPNHLASIKVAERAGLHRTNKFSGREVVWASRVEALPDA